MSYHARYNANHDLYIPQGARLRKLQQQLAKACVTSGNAANINVIGDGTGAGVGATAAYSQAWPQQLRSILPALLGTSGSVVTGFIGAGSGGTGAPALQSGFTAGSGWSLFGVNSVSLNPPTGMYFANNGAAGNLDYAPPDSAQWDTADIIFVRTDTAAPSSFDVWVNSGTHTVVNGSGWGAGPHKVTVTATLGTNTLHIGPPAAAGRICVAYVRCYNSAAIATISPIASNGGTSPMFATNSPYSQSLSAFTDATNGARSHLLIIESGINEATVSNAISAATHKTDLGLIVAAQQAAGGDVLLMVPWIGDGTSTAFPQRDAYDLAAYQIADQYSVPLLDLGRRFGPLSGYSGVYGSYPHLDEYGYQAVARCVGRAIASLV